MKRMLKTHKRDVSQVCVACCLCIHDLHICNRRLGNTYTLVSKLRVDSEMFTGVDLIARRVDKQYLARLVRDIPTEKRKSIQQIIVQFTFSNL